jgi:hypothetical protein
VSFFWTGWIWSTPFLHSSISIISTSIFFPLQLCLPSGLFTSGFHTRSLYAHLCVPHDPPIYILWFDQPNIPQVKGSLGSRRLSLPERLGSRYMTVVRLLALHTGCLYPTRGIPGTESTPGPWRGQKVYVNEKFQWHHRESNSLPSGLWRSASTNCTPSHPYSESSTFNNNNNKNNNNSDFKLFGVANKFSVLIRLVGETKCDVRTELKLTDNTTLIWFI